MHYFEEIGLSLEAPEGWYVQPDSFVAENRERLFDDARVKKATLPVLCVTKRQETGDTINPAIQVLFRPSPDPRRSAVEVLERMLPPIVEMLDAEIVDDVMPCTLDDEPCAYARARYWLGDDTNVYEIVSRIWMITRGDYLIMISGAAPAEGPDESTEEIEQVIQSVKLTTPPWLL